VSAKKTRKPARTPRSEKPAAPAILPMELRVGAHLCDETGEYEVIGRPYTTAGGKQPPWLNKSETARTLRGETRNLVAWLCAVVAVVLLTAGCAASSVSICLHQEKGISASEDARSQAGCAPSRPPR
jgi:hypothetical protein